MSKCDTPDCDKDANWYGSRNLCTTCLHKAAVDAPRLRRVIAKVWDLMQNSNHQDREMFFWGIDGNNTGWMKVHEELAMKELNWGEQE